MMRLENTAAASTQDKQLSSEKMAKTDLATKVGELVAQRCQENGIKSVVFDRNGFRYHGRVKAMLTAPVKLA